MKTNKKIDLVITFFLIALGCIMTVIFNLKPLTGGIIAFLSPSIYLILREKKNLLKILWGVIIFGIIFGFIYDFVAVFNEAWVVPVYRLVIPWRLFGFLPIDDLFAFVLMALIVIVFYEHFLDDEKDPRISRNLVRALITPSIVVIILLVVYFVDSDLLRIPYAYFVTGILAIIFPISVALKKSRFLRKFSILAAFFFVVWLMAELAGLKVDGWIFPGQYIGTVEIFDLKFPLEEVFFWMLFYAATIVSYYEYYVDDAK